MGLLSRSRKKDLHNDIKEKLLDVDASMQGSLVFRDPVNLRINGKFEGSLETKGNLTLGETAVVNADIVGDSIVVVGSLTGSIVAQKELKLIAPARIVGSVKTPSLSVEEGATLHGNCQMLSSAQMADLNLNMMSVEEVAAYLEIDAGNIIDLAKQGKIPGLREGNGWKFDKSNIDQWIADGKIK